MNDLFPQQLGGRVRWQQQLSGGSAAAVSNQGSATISRCRQQWRRRPAAIADHMQMLLGVLTARGGEWRQPAGATNSVGSTFS